MFSLPICCSPAISSSTGTITLHGPHHSAQKSTSTGTSEALTCSSNVASSKVTIFSLITSPQSPGTSPLQVVQHRPCPVCSQVPRSGPACLQPPLGVDGRHAARAGGGDRLAVDVVLDVAAGEDPFDAGGRAAEGPDVPVLLELELALHHAG